VTAEWIILFRKFCGRTILLKGRNIIDKLGNVHFVRTNNALGHGTLRLSCDVEYSFVRAQLSYLE